MRTKLNDEDGQALILALAFLVFFGLVITAMLSFATTNLLATQRLGEDRAARYAADSAMDGAIQYARTPPAGLSAGAYGAVPCITFSYTDPAGVAATVTCKSLANPTDLDRKVQFTASVGTVPKIQATVLFHDSTSGSGPPAVDVSSWTVCQINGPCS
jgi:hypothetical protein